MWHVMNWFDFVEQVLNKMGFYLREFAIKHTPIMCSCDYFCFEDVNGVSVHEFYF